MLNVVFDKTKKFKYLDKSKTLREKLTKEPANKQKRRHLCCKIIAENVIPHFQETHEISFLSRQIRRTP